MEDKDFKKFEDVFTSIERNTGYQAESLSSIHGFSLYNKTEESETVPILAKLLDLTQKQVELNEENISINKESKDREKTDELLKGKEKEKEPIERERYSFEPDMDFSFADIMKGVVFLPYLYKFTEGFIEEFFDGLIDITPAGVTGAISAIRGKYNSLAKMFSGPMTKTLDVFNDSFILIKDKLKPVASFTSKIANFISGVAKSFTSGPVGQTLKAMSNFSGVTAISRMVGRIAWPLTILIGAYDGVTKFMNTEGSFIEKFLAGIGGFIGEVVGAPLDLLKGAVAWILSKFGWESASEKLKEYSFEESINNLFGGISTFFTSIIDWVENLFDNPTEALSNLWTNALGAYSSLSDLMFYPIDQSIRWISNVFNWEPGKDFSFSDMVQNSISSAWNWVKNMFSWESAIESLEVNSNMLSNMLSNTMDSIQEWFKDLFDFLPSVNEMKQYLMKALPEWMQRGIGAFSEDEKDLNQRLEKLYSDLEDAKDRARNSRDSAGSSAEVERIQRHIDETEQQLSSEPSRNNILSLTEAGNLVTIHRQRMDIPFDTSDGGNILEQKTDRIYNESNNISRQGSPVILKGGDTISRPNIDRRSNSSTTIINNNVDPVRKNNHVY